MSKFLYPIYKLKTKSYIKWWLYHKKAGGSGILSEILEGFSFNLENTLNRKFKLFEIEGNSVQDGSPSPDNEVPILSAGDNGSINEKIQNKNVLDYKEMFNNAEDYSSAFKIYRKKLQPNTSYTTSSNFPYTNTETGFIIVNSTDEPSTVNYGLRGEITTTTNSDGIICIYIRKYSAQQIIPILENFESGTYYIQTELGTTATPYVEHEEQDYSIFVQQPFRSIGDVRDCFVKVDGNWFERHYIGRKIFDGTESWISQQNCFTLSINDIKPTPNYADRNQLITISNYYIGQVSGYRDAVNDLHVCKAIDAGNPRQVAIKDTSKTLAEFKAWLAEQYASGKPVYVNYLLAEPLDLPCTPEQIQQLENLPSTYKDFTIINSEDETPAHLKIQYYKEG